MSRTFYVGITLVKLNSRASLSTEFFYALRCATRGPAARGNFIRCIYGTAEAGALIRTSSWPKNSFIVPSQHFMRGPELFDIGQIDLLSVHAVILDTVVELLLDLRTDLNLIFGRHGQIA